MRKDYTLFLGSKEEKWAGLAMRLIDERESDGDEGE
jgi:hypothetical protein